MIVALLISSQCPDGFRNFDCSVLHNSESELKIKRMGSPLPVYFHLSWKWHQLLISAVLALAVRQFYSDRCPFSCNGIPIQVSTELEFRVYTCPGTLDILRLDYHGGRRGTGSAVTRGGTERRRRLTQPGLGSVALAQ
jgi:hypothetical protein